MDLDPKTSIAVSQTVITSASFSTAVELVNHKGFTQQHLPVLHWSCLKNWQQGSDHFQPHAMLGKNVSDVNIQTNNCVLLSVYIQQKQNINTYTTLVFHVYMSNFQPLGRFCCILHPWNIQVCLHMHSWSPINFVNFSMAANPMRTPLFLTSSSSQQTFSTIPVEWS